MIKLQRTINELLEGRIKSVDEVIEPFNLSNTLKHLSGSTALTVTSTANGKTMEEYWPHPQGLYEFIEENDVPKHLNEKAMTVRHQVFEHYKGSKKHFFDVALHKMPENANGSKKSDPYMKISIVYCEK